VRTALPNLLTCKEIHRIPPLPEGPHLPASRWKNRPQQWESAATAVTTTRCPSHRLPPIIRAASRHQQWLLRPPPADPTRPMEDSRHPTTKAIPTTRPPTRLHLAPAHRTTPLDLRVLPPPEVFFTSLTYMPHMATAALHLPSVSRSERSGKISRRKSARRSVISSSIAKSRAFVEVVSRRGPPLRMRRGPTTMDNAGIPRKAGA